MQINKTEDVFMRRKLGVVVSLVLLVSMLGGCVGTPVVYNNNCQCGDELGAKLDEILEAVEDISVPAPAAGGEQVSADSEAVKTGLSVMVSLADSTDADAENAGAAKFDITVAAVSVGDDGVIDSCVIDSVPATINFDAEGAITSDLTAEVPTKDEMGENYGMKLYGGAKFEWNEQAAALAAYAEGKTLEELKEGAVGETGMAVDADLASTATIYLGGYVAAIEEAVNQAQHLGAMKGDELRLAVISGLGSSADADAENAGVAQLDSDFAVLTMNNDVITSCYLDSVQAKVNFDTEGAITSDLTADVLTKNELGENYGMKLYAGAQYEWNEQAASLAAYVTGKTAAEVTGIAVDERTAPTDADLASSVTIAIGGLKALIEKAAE